MKTLIAYTTKYGATAKCVEMLERKLKGAVDVVDLQKSKALDLTQYDKIIIGGSIYAGSIQKQVTDFCNQNLALLQTKKIALFISCMSEPAAPAQIQKSFPQELLDIAVFKGSLGGEFNFSKMNFIEKMIIKVALQSLLKDKPGATFTTKKDISDISKDKIEELALAMNRGNTTVD